MTKTVYLSGLKYIDCELLRVSNKRELGCILVLLSFSEAYKSRCCCRILSSTISQLKKLLLNAMSCTIKQFIGT